MDVDVTINGELSSLAITPETRLVLRTDAHLTLEVAADIKHRAFEWSGVAEDRILVLGRGTSVEVLEKGGED